MSKIIIDMTRGFDVITKANKAVKHFADIESARKYASERKMTVRYWAVGAEEKGGVIPFFLWVDVVVWQTTTTG